MSKLGKLHSACVRVGILAFAVVSSAHAAESANPPRWKTGKQFRLALASRLEVVGLSPGTPVRSALERLSERQEVAVMLDRRVDPSRGIELDLRDITLAQLLDEIAARCDATPSYIGSVVYLGPREATCNLSKVVTQRVQAARRLPRAVARNLAATQRWRWDELTVPKELVTALAEQVDMVVEGLDLIPHDLWPAADLPPLTWIERMTLVLTGFDLTFEVLDRGKRVRLIPLPRQSPDVRSYGSTLSKVDLSVLSNRFPNARVESSGDAVRLYGTVEEHERLRRLLQDHGRQTPPRRTGGKTVHSLKVTNQPVGAIVSSLQRKLDLRFEVAADAGPKLHTRVTLDLKDVTLDQLLTETLTPAGLVFERTDKRITVRVR